MYSYLSTHLMILMILVEYITELSVAIALQLVINLYVLIRLFFRINMECIIHNITYI